MLLQLNELCQHPHTGLLVLHSEIALAVRKQNFISECSWQQYVALPVHSHPALPACSHHGGPAQAGDTPKVL